MKLKDIIGSMASKFAALAVTFGLAGGAWGADPVTIQDAGGNNISVYEVSSGFYQDAATYTASRDFYITSKAGLEYFRDLVNQVGTVADTYVSTFSSGTVTDWYQLNVFNGKTVHLMTDVDLNNEEWSPIGEPGNAAGDKRYFYGNFNGEGHTISNLKATAYTEAVKTWYAGLFGTFGIIPGGHVYYSNLTIHNVTLVGYDYAGAIVGNANSNASTFNNCHVTGDIDITCTMTGAFVGGIVGIGTSELIGCSVKGNTGSVIKGSTVGGLAGTSTRSANSAANTITGSTVTGVTVKSDDNGGQAGGLVGKATNPVTVTGNTVHGVTVSAEAGKADVLVGGVGGDVTASSNTTDTNVTVISKPEAKLGSEDSAGKGMSLAELAASWGAAYANEVITLGQDVALDKRIYFYKGVTIDLNGHKLTLQAETSPGFFLDDGSIMVLKDSGTGGTFEHAYVGGIAIWVKTGSSLTFKNGIYNVGGNLTYNNGGTIAIESGVYTVGLSNVAIWTGSGTSTVSGGYFNVTRDTINWVVDGKLVEEVKEGQYAGYYLVRDIVDSDYVAENTTTGKRYLTLSDAMAEAKSGEVVQLIKTAVSGTLSFVPDGVVFNDNGFASTVISGAGTPSDPYLIKDIDLLKAFRNSVNAGSKFAGKYFKLTSDIDLNNEEWTPIGDYYKEFCGVFDGDNHTISNLRVTAGGRSAYGLFGRVMKEDAESSNPAGIVNVTINNATVKSPAHWAGALAGEVYTGLAVENCHLKGDIDISVSSDGGYYAGGLVGKGGYVAYVDCSVKGNEGSKISGALYVGGIVAWHAEASGIIRKCSVEGVSLNGQTWVGGIAGLAHSGSTVAECSVANINVAATDNGYAGQIVGRSLGKAGSLTTVVDNTVDAKTVVVTAGGEEVAVQIGTENDPYAIVGWGVEKDTDGKVVGGTFERLATEALADGYILSEPNAQGLYTVEKEPVAQIGETKYTSLAEAVEAVPENGAEATTIKMIADEELGNAYVEISAGKNIILDLNGKTVTSTHSGDGAIYNKGTLTVMGNGTINGNVAAFENEGTLTVENGTFTGTYVIYASSGYVTVNGGTLTGGDVAITIGQYPDSQAKYQSNQASSLTVAGGVIQCAGTSGYAIVTQVPTALGAEGTSDAELSISGGIGAVTAMYGCAPVSIYSGSYSATSDSIANYTAVVTASGGATVAIYGGTFTSSAAAKNYAACSGNASPVTISGGTFNGNIRAEGTASSLHGHVAISGTAVVNGDLVNLSDVSNSTYSDVFFDVSGGSFARVVPEAYCAADYSPVTTPDANDMYTVVSDYEAQIVRNDAVVQKGTLADMVAAAESGDTVTLLKDVDLGTTGLVIADGKNFTLNIGEYDITGTVNGKLITNNGTVTVEGTTGCIYNQDISAQGHDAFLNNGTATINGGWFGDSDNDKTNGNNINRGAGFRNFGTATINGGHFTAGDNYLNGGWAYAIINGDDSNNPTLTINNADVYGKNNGNIANNSGTVTVNGGTFDISGAASYYSVYSYSGDTVVTGGTFTKSGNNNSQFCVEVDKDNKDNPGTIAVSGGSFTKLVPEQYCADGYIPNAAQDPETGMYTVKTGSYVAQIGTTKYETLAAAIAAAEAAASSERTTVALLTNTTEVIEIDFTYPILIDGQGFGISQAAASAHTGIKITAPHADVIIQNATVGNANVGRAVNILGAEGVTLLIKDSALYGNYYPLNVYPNGTAGVDNENITVTNSVISGPCALNLWGTNGVVKVVDSTLSATNTWSHSSGADGNDFGVIVLEGLTGTPGANGYDIEIKGSTIEAAQTTGNMEHIVLFNPNSQGNTVKLDGCVISRNGDTTHHPVIDEEANTSGNSLYVRNTTDAATSAIPVLPDGYAYANADSEGWRLVIKPVVAVIAADGVTTNGVYATLADAFAAARTDETIELLVDLTENFSYTEWASLRNKSLALAGNHTLTSTSEWYGYYFGDYDSGNRPETDQLAISNVTFAKSGGNYTLLFDGVAASLNGVTVNGSANTALSYANGATGVLENVTVANTGSHSATWRNAAIALQGIGAGPSQVIVKSGSYTSQNGYAAYIFSSGGILTIDGGDFVGKFCANIDRNSYHNDYNQSWIYINGGKFKNVVFETSGNTDYCGYVISGGVFDAEPDASYIAPGYMVVANTDEDTKEAYPYTVGVKPLVIETATESILDITAESIPHTSGQTVVFYESNDKGGQWTELEGTPKIASLPDNGAAKTYTFKAVVTDTTSGAEVKTYTIENTVGILHVAESACGKTTIIGVPWFALGEKITVDSIVYLGNRSVGDTITAYDGTTYWTWELQEDSTTKALSWQPAYKMATGSNDQVEISEPASEFELQRGQGLFLTRKDVKKPIYLVGRADGTGTTPPTTLAAGSASKPTWTLVAAPSTTPLNLNAATSPFKVTSANDVNDVISLPTKGAGIKIPYTYKNGKWGTISTKTVEIGGDSYTVPVRDTEHTTIPAGTGFWYLNKGDQKSVQW